MLCSHSGGCFQAITDKSVSRVGKPRVIRGLSVWVSDTQRDMTNRLFIELPERMDVREGSAR
jgi:hypothetical protein